MGWVELKKAWHDTSVENCDVCGSLLIGRFWSFADTDGTALRACREDDVELRAWLAEQYSKENEPRSTV